MRFTKKYFQFLLLTLATMCILCSCGGGHTVGYSGGSQSENNAGSFDIVTNDSTSKAEFAEDIAIAEAGNSAMGSTPGSPPSAGDQTEKKPASEKKVSTDMLVYRGGVTTQTLDFNQAVQDFKTLMADYGAFVEDERMGTNDGYRYSYSDKAELKYTYNATVRIPSAKFNEFFEKAQGVGTTYGAWSNVENISQRYTTATTQLEIYQTKYERYLKLLSEAYNVEDMIEIERELTNIELKLAEYKTAISTMETDVAYSYLDMEIIEVRKSTEIKKQSKTFIERLKETVMESVDVFLVFLECVLFFLIMYWWYILLIWLGVWLFLRWNKKRIARYQEERAKGNLPSGNPSRNYQAVRPMPSPQSKPQGSTQTGYPGMSRPVESLSKEDKTEMKTVETIPSDKTSTEGVKSTEESSTTEQSEKTEET